MPVWEEQEQWQRKKKIMGCGIRKHKLRLVLVQEICIKVWQGEMSWPIQCLLCKHGNLNEDLQSPQHDLGAAVCFCDPSITEAETGGSQAREGCCCSVNRQGCSERC